MKAPFSQWTPTLTKTPPSRETQARSEQVHEHLQASNTELEVLIPKLGVPKTKAMLLQQEELIEFRGPGEKCLSHYAQRA